MMARHHNRRGALAVAFAGTLSAGCHSEFERVEFQVRSSAPVHTEIDSDHVDIRVGIAAGVIAIPIADGKEMDDDDDLALYAEDPEVLGLDPTVEHRSFVFYGKSPGTTAVRIFVNDDYAGKIDAQVTNQPQDLEGD
jgi:hypothetical protein